MTMAQAEPASIAEQARALRQDEKRQEMLHAALLLPAMIVVGVVALIPVGLMIYLSLIGKDGGFSFENYTRLLDSPVYARVFLTTFRLSVVTTLVCLLLGVPLAYYLSTLRRRTANLLLIAVLLPLWTSVLVRTYAWLAILQRNGVINSFGMDLGLWTEPLALSFNETGALIGTIHIMLPYMTLPIYSAMTRVDRSLVNAAESMGARPLRAFFTVTLPLSSAGIAAGTIVTFVLCLGFYVVPEILGGGKVVVLAMKIASDVQMFFNWGAAGALGVVLLAMTLALMWIAHRLSPRSLPGE